LGEGCAAGLEARGFGEFPAGIEDEFIAAEAGLASFGQFRFALRGLNGSGGFGQSIGRLDLVARAADLFRRIRDWLGTKLAGGFCLEGGRGDNEAGPESNYQSKRVLK
jgi:hypothetical protein